MGILTVQQARQQGAAPDRLQPTLLRRFGFQRRVSLVVRRLLSALTQTIAAQPRMNNIVDRDFSLNPVCPIFLKD